MLIDLLVPQKVMPRRVFVAIGALQGLAASAIVGFPSFHLNSVFSLNRTGHSLFVSRQRRGSCGRFRSSFFSPSLGTWTLSKKRNPTLMSENVLTYFLFGGLHEQQ